MSQTVYFTNCKHVVMSVQRSQKDFFKCNSKYSGTVFINYDVFEYLVCIHLT